MEKPAALTTRKLPTGCTEARLGELAVVVDKDGYINATLLCQSGGKQLGHWRNNKRTSDFLDCLSTTIGIPMVALLRLSNNEAVGERHTWVHPKVAVSLAQWISPQYEVFVSDVIERYHKGDLTLAKEVVTNHDQVHGTTSTVTVNTVLGKRKAELETAEIDARIVRAKLEKANLIRNALAEYGVLDKETEQFIASTLKTDLLLLEGPGATNAPFLWPVTNRAQHLGYKVKPGEDAALGRLAKRAHFKKFGRDPARKTIFHRDAARDVWAYTEEECRACVDDVIRAFFSS